MFSIFIEIQWCSSAVARIMKDVIFVHTGEVTSGNSDVLLHSGAVGSCVVITAFDPVRNTGAMAHVMLPGTAPSENSLNQNRNAANAFEELLNQLCLSNVSKEDIEFCLIGGANILRQENQNIGKEIIDSVQNLLDEKGLKVSCRAIGGFERRTVIFDIEKGCVHYTVGESKQKILWQSPCQKSNTYLSGNE